MFSKFFKFEVLGLDFKPPQSHTVKVSDESQGIEAVGFQNHAMNIFFRNTPQGNLERHFFRESLFRKYCPHLTLPNMESYQAHPLFHKNGDNSLAHEHILRKDSRALLVKDTQCILDFLRLQNDCSSLSGNILTQADATNIQQEYQDWYPVEASFDLKLPESYYDQLFLPVAFMMHEMLLLLMFKYLKPFFTKQGASENTSRNLVKIIIQLNADIINT